jgi:hypothetical protein
MNNTDCPPLAPLAPHQPRPARDAAYALERGAMVAGQDRVPEGARARLSAFIEFLTLDNTQRSVFALLLVLLVLGDHLIPALTPLSRVCLELVSAVKQRHRALTEKRYTREQRL